MDIATIGPIDVLRVVNGRYHLVLAHEYNKAGTYHSFYIGEALGFKIIDNSAHELGSGDGDHLERVARETGAEVVVLPDRLFWGEDTFEMSKERLHLWEDGVFRPSMMVVPQGRTLKEWHKCLTDLLTLRPAFVGISKDYEVWRGGIRHLIKIVQNDAPDVQIHLLGLGRLLPAYRGIADTGVRGIDTAKHVVYAMNGISLPPRAKDFPKYPRRSADFFELEHLSTQTLDLCLHNLDMLKRYLGITA